MKNDNNAKGANEVVQALHALAVLDVAIVERCPVSACPLCGPAFPIAA